MIVDVHHVDQTDTAFKEQVFRAMDQLDGWCSKEKASVLMDLVIHTKPEIVVEIGVFGGKSLIPMAFALRRNGSGMAYGIDPYQKDFSQVGQDGQNLHWWSTVDHKKVLNKLLAKITQFGLKDYVHLEIASSQDAPEIPNIDILHIDGNHSEESSLADVQKWVPLVREGGLIILDDLTWGATNDRAATTHKATEWVDQRCHKLAEYHGDNVWAVWVKQ